MRRVLAIALSAAALGGCSSGSEKALGVAEDWLDAVAEKDVEGACGAMTPVAAKSVAARYVDLPPSATCTRVMEKYADEFDPRKMRILRDAGLETEGMIEDGRLGVFPAARRHQFEILLMQQVDGDWKVTSVAVPPTGAGVRTQ
jgi:hypothetical protein